MGYGICSRELALAVVERVGGGCLENTDEVPLEIEYEVITVVKTNVQQIDTQ